jgi:hypothetical protein
MVGIASGGVYTETFVTATGGKNIASLYASRGYMAEAPNLARKIVSIIMNFFRRRREF